MRLSVIASTSLALVAFSVPVLAQEATPSVGAPDTTPAASPKESGLELGARLGYALPLGKYSGENGAATIGDTVSGSVPLLIDAGYRINSNFYVGAYGQYGYGLVNSKACADGASCSAQSYRLGVNAHYHFLPSGTFDPWVGLGTGYEWLHFGGERNGASQSLTTHGFEIVNLQVGGDYKVSNNVALGPFASFSLASYGNASETDKSPSGNEATRSVSVEKTAFHQWLTFGIRGRFDL